MQRSVPCASDLAELPVPVIWQNCLCVEERASGLAELPVCGQCFASGLAELPLYKGVCSDLAELPAVCCVSDLAELLVCGQCASGFAELPAVGGRACQ